MVASRDSSPRSLSSQNAAGSHMQAFDEQDFDRAFDSTTQQRNDNTETSSFQPKKFVAYKDEISKVALSEGFCFSQRHAPRPGQFSQNPFLNSPNTLRSFPTVSQPRIISQQHVDICSPKKIFAPPPPPSTVGVPLDLPELGLHSIVNDEGHSFKDFQVDQASCISTTLNKPRLLNGGLRTSIPPLLPSKAFGINKTSGTSRYITPKPLGPVEDFYQSAPSQIAVSAPFQEPDLTKTHRGGPGLVKSSSSPFRDSDNTLPIAACVSSNTRQAQHRRSSIKLPPNELQEAKKAQGRHSPPSICGDLEPPARLSPANARRASRDDWYQFTHPSGTSPRLSEMGKGTRRRPNSQASNISKKRTSVHKHKSRADPERKKAAMHQVAQFWNECMQIAEEENIQASTEIERLQDDILLQKKMLQESRSTLSAKETRLQKVEDHCKRLEQDGSRIMDENKMLSGEVGSLRDKLSESKESSVAMADKHRAYRTKLNEAIKEQQNLFLRSRSFYEDMVEKIHEEKSKQAVASEAIDKALENSHKKSDEMRRCVQELHTETQREIQHSKDMYMSESCNI